MKNSFILFVAGAFVFLLVSCAKNSSESTGNPAIPVPTPIAATTLTVSADKSQIKANGTEQAVFTVKDNNNTDVTSSSVIYVNNIALTGNVFSTTTPGNYQVKAVKGNSTSAVVNLTAADLTASVFIQKTLAEFYTGAWCGICPGTSIPLASYVNVNPNTIIIGIHGPNGSSDPYIYMYDRQLRNAFGVSAVPTVVLNRNGNWDGNNATLDQLSSNKAPLGIGIQTSLSGGSVSVKTQVKFGSTITAPVKLVVMLVEDSLLYNQTNYGHFNLPNPIVNYAHRNVLRSTATDIFGDAVPVAQQTKDNIWEKSFTIDASKYTLGKLKVVAFLLYDTNSQGFKGVLNAHIVTAGQTVSF
jgi:hypothetical protein